MSGAAASVRVLWFASLADLSGAHQEDWTVSPSESVASLWKRAVERHPGLEARQSTLRVACDEKWVKWDASLDGVREVAFLPPVSGG